MIKEIIMVNFNEIKALIMRALNDSNISADQRLAEAVALIDCVDTESLADAASVAGVFSLSVIECDHCGCLSDLDLTGARDSEDAYTCQDCTDAGFGEDADDGFSEP